MRKDNEKGITLIALVVTIIVLLILAGITINLVFNNNGILKRTENAKKLTRVGQVQEEVNLWKMNNQVAERINGEGKVVLEDFTQELLDKKIITSNEKVFIDNNKVISIEGTDIEFEEYIPKEINTTWDKLHLIAKDISNDANITNRTMIITKQGVTLGVGDYMNVEYTNETGGKEQKKVRILGFNHDNLSDEIATTAYGESTVTGKAGISFEFVDFLGEHNMNSKTDANPNGTNLGGWINSEMKIYLNGEITKLNNNKYIKEVKKIYIPKFDIASIDISVDKLWLLSCSEVFSDGYNGGRGYAITDEGEQYKYYTKCTDSYNSRSYYRKKTKDSNTYFWWLRSPYYANSDSFCGLGRNGGCFGSPTYTVNGVTPGFSI